MEREVGAAAAHNSSIEQVARASLVGSIKESSMQTPLQYLMSVLLCCAPATLKGTNAEDRSIQPVKEWVGLLATQEETKAAPLNRSITTESEWKQLWKAWRPDESLPSIDFSKHIGIVQLGGMYHVRFQLKVSPHGDLKVSWHPLHTPSRGYGYGIAVIERNGILSVEGNALNAGVHNDSEKTLLHWLSQSELVVQGEIVSEPSRASEEVGVVYYLCDFKVVDTIKGRHGADGKLPIRITRYELEEGDRLPELRKGSRCILFLKNAGSVGTPRWTTVEVWFSVQRYSPTLVRELKRLAK